MWPWRAGGHFNSQMARGMVGAEGEAGHSRQAVKSKEGTQEHAKSGSWKSVRD